VRCVVAAVSDLAGEMTEMAVRCCPTWQGRNSNDHTVRCVVAAVSDLAGEMTEMAVRCCPTLQGRN
jgi:hypothetical protein